MRFWLPDDRVVAVEPGTLPSISAAYTFDTWEGVLRPWLQTADDLAPQSEAALADFRKGYFEAYFRAWGQFQARFFEGVQLWRGHYDDLRIRAASTRSEEHTSELQSLMRISYAVFCLH